MTAGTAPAPQRFWKVKPFYENRDLASIQQELTDAALNGTPTSNMSTAARLARALLGLDESSAAHEEVEREIDAWRKDPFNPHAIARMRPLAYQKAVVMKYIENLIAWGDQLFQRDTLESLNEATQLYVLAGQLLGPRPAQVRQQEPRPSQTFEQLRTRDMGEFSDPVIDTEALVLPPRTSVLGRAGSGLTYESPPHLDTLYFCVPSDEMLLGLWDTVADRLFKLRHCMNIEGVVRQLPLFEPPIDPALLVRATAAGVDLASALDDINPLLPHYRFSVMHAKAMELASSVAALGGAYLSALEKKDAEGLSRLRSGQEIDLLTAVRDVKQQQIDEAQRTRDGLQKALEIATERRDYYARLPKVSAGEVLALGLSKVAASLGAVAQGIALGAAPAHQVPDIAAGSAGAFGTPFMAASYGGANAGTAVEAASKALSMASAIAHDDAATIGTLAGYDRRWEEWQFQKRLADKEIKQVNKQILAAEIRLAVAEKELENQELQIQHAKEVGDYLRDKFSNEDLYDWMSAELSKVYFQSYKLAYDVAQRAEKAFQFERAVEGTSYITFGYWDSLKKGLLAGERLQHDLRRLEVAYLEQNAREYEITKHVSLAEYDPEALMDLRRGGDDDDHTNGSCTVTLKESLFDRDYPGHYMRRIKSVSLTIPAVNGPYSGVNCMLTLNAGSSVRKSTSTANGYLPSDDRDVTDDQSFSVSYVPVTNTIVTSSAQNDGGLFELNFRDERYLPFEGAGALSKWTISLPKNTNRFDVSAVSDVILHIRYTARDGGSSFRDDVTGAVVASSRQGKSLFSLRTEFPEVWSRLVEHAASDHTFTFSVDESMFPYGAEIGSAAPTANTRTSGGISDLNLTVTVPTQAPAHTWKVDLGDANIAGLLDVLLMVSYSLPAA